MGSVTPVRGCRLRTFERRWDWPDLHRPAIEAHWEAARRDNPGYFDGEIFVLGPWRIVDGVFEGELLPARFREHLYWRAQGFPAEAGVRDGFGAGLIRSVEGHVILGRQRAGNVNGGQTYLPSGFIDRNDIGVDGAVTIAHSVAREVAEETGLGSAELEQEAGHFVVEAGALVAIVCPFRSVLPAGDLVERIRGYVAAQEEAELAEAVVIGGPEYDRADILEHTQVLLDWLYREGR